MANTYTQIYLHVIFAVKGRDNLISSMWKEELYKYITGIVTNKNQKLIAINGMPNHVHLLVGLKPDVALSDLIRDVKANSSKFINDKRWVRENLNGNPASGDFHTAIHNWMLLSITSETRKSTIKQNHSGRNILNL